MKKGKRSVVKLAKAAADRQSSSRHRRRRLEKIKAKLEAQGYTLPKGDLN